MSWTLPTLADWCTFFNRTDLYLILANGSKNKYSRVCQQLWHPTVELYDVLYFEQSAHTINGVSEAPIILPPTIEAYRERIDKVLERQELNILAEPSNRSFKAGIDFVAYRHFRTMIPPIILYSEFQQNGDSIPLQG